MHENILKGKKEYGSAACNAKEEYEIEERHKIANPGKVDEALWEKAKRASQEAFGEIRYPFVTYWYKKQGGTFG